MSNFLYISDKPMMKFQIQKNKHQAVLCAHTGRGIFVSLSIGL
jgi:hypothetical protein